MFDQLVSWWVRGKVEVPEGWTDVRERPSPQVSNTTVGWFKTTDEGFMGAIFYHPGEEKPWAAAGMVNEIVLFDAHFYRPEVPFAALDKIAASWSDTLRQPYMVALREFDWGSPVPAEDLIVPEFNDQPDWSITTDDRDPDS